jgi:alpha-tubulin suppressor-like RCC1 family protein
MYSMQSVPEPIQSDELINRKVMQIAAGQSHAACISESGELFYWGMSLYFEPIRMDALLHTKIVYVACGHDYTMAIDTNGKMYSFGNGYKNGTLGQGSSIKSLSQATLMESFDYNTNHQTKVQYVSAGWKHAGCLVQQQPL